MNNELKNIARIVYILLLNWHLELIDMKYKIFLKEILQFLQSD